MSSTSLAQHITVSICFANVQPNVVAKIPWVNGITALQATHAVASVLTVAMGSHTIVASINGVKAVSGVKSWYYKHNQKSATQTAASNVLSPGDSVS